MGRMSLEDDKGSVRPSTSTIPQNVPNRILRSPSKKLLEISNVSFRTVQTILMFNLNLHRVAVMFVPRLVTQFRSETAPR